MRAAYVAAVCSAMLTTGCPQPRTAALPKNYTERIPGTAVTFDMIYIGKGVYIGKTEVTWDEFEQFYLGKDVGGEDAITRPSPSYEPHDRGWGRGKRPAVGISWHAAKTYCEWLSKKTGKKYRLPTEAEWESACQDHGALDESAWYQVNSGGATHEVATKKPNALGLYDMLGNAMEYCRDLVDDVPVLRGGSWKDSSPSRSSRQKYLEEWNERDPQRPRSVWWVADGPFVGFRLARSAD